MIGLLAIMLAAPAPPMDCGYTPAWHRPTTTTAVFVGRAGCGMAPQTPDAWQTVTDVEVARIHTGAQHTRVEVVFLNKDLQRVLPIGRSLRFDMQFTLKAKGAVVLKDHRDGVFEIDLPPGARTGRCDTHLYLYFQASERPGARPRAHWLDDWLLKC